MSKLILNERVLVHKDAERDRESEGMQDQDIYEKGRALCSPAQFSCDGSLLVFPCQVVRAYAFSRGRFFF